MLLLQPNACSHGILWHRLFNLPFLFCFGFPPSTLTTITSHCTNIPAPKRCVRAHIIIYCVICCGVFDFGVAVAVFVFHKVWVRSWYRWADREFASRQEPYFLSPKGRGVGKRDTNDEESGCLVDYCNTTTMSTNSYRATIQQNKMISERREESMAPVSTCWCSKFNVNLKLK